MKPAERAFLHQQPLEDIYNVPRPGGESEMLEDGVRRTTHLPETDLAIARQHSGRAKHVNPNHGRYVAFGVTGWPITPGAHSAPSGQQIPQTAWAVLDSEDCWREVAWFIPKGGPNSADLEADAKAKARELNLQHAAEMELNAQETDA